MKKALTILFVILAGLWAVAQRIEVSTGLPGLLSGLSVGNGGGVLTNAASPAHYFYTNTRFSGLMEHFRR